MNKCISRSVEKLRSCQVDLFFSEQLTSDLNLIFAHKSRCYSDYLIKVGNTGPKHAIQSTCHYRILKGKDIHNQLCKGYKQPDHAIQSGHVVIKCILINMSQVQRLS